MKKQIIAFTLVLSMIASISLKGTAINIDAKKTSVTKKKITMTVGEKKTIKHKKNTKIKWKSSNKKVVTVNKKGVIKAKKVGKAKVTATYSGKKIEYIVKVNKKIDTTIIVPTAAPVSTPAPQTQKPAETQAPTVTTTPEATLTPTEAPIATPEPENNNTLSFDIDQKPISSKTKTISGSLALPEYESILKISVNGTLLKQIDLKNGETTYSVDIDLSSYSVGNKITLSREYTGSEKDILNFEKTLSIY